MQNLPEGVKNISEFFNLPLTDEQVSSVAGESTFNAMLENSQKSHGNFGSIFFRKGKTSLYDGSQIKSTQMFILKFLSYSILYIQVKNYKKKNQCR